MKRTIILIILFAVPFFCFLILKNIDAEELPVSPSSPKDILKQFENLPGLKITEEKGKELEKLLEMPTGKMNDDIWMEILSQLACFTKINEKVDDAKFTEMVKPYGVTGEEWLAYYWQVMTGKRQINFDKLKEEYEKKIEELKKNNCKFEKEIPYTPTPSPVSCSGFCTAFKSCPSGTIYQTNCPATKKCQICGLQRGRWYIFFHFKKCCKDVPRICCFAAGKVGTPTPTPTSMSTLTPTYTPAPISCPGFCAASQYCPPNTFGSGTAGCEPLKSCRRCGIFGWKECCDYTPRFCCITQPLPTVPPTPMPTPTAIPTPIPICTDSDGGKDYYVKGETTDFGDVRKDACFDSNTLTEFYCEQTAGQTRPSRAAEQKKCEYGCSDGACVPSPTPTPTLIPTPFPSPSPFVCPYNCQAAKQKWEFGRGTYWVTECGENEIAEPNLFCPPTAQCYSCGFWGLERCCVQVNSLCCKTK